MKPNYRSQTFTILLLQTASFGAFFGAKLCAKESAAGLANPSNPAAQSRLISEDPEIAASTEAAIAQLANSIHALFHLFEQEVKNNALSRATSQNATDEILANQDFDKDGFSNIEELRARTNPYEAVSKPAPWTKLRVIGSKIDKLRVKFMSLPTGSIEEVSINTISAENPTELSGSTRFYRKDDMIVLAERGPDGKEKDQATPLKFERAELRKQFNPTTNVEEEVPVAFLRNTAGGMEIELQRGEVKDSPYSLATLQDTRTGGQSYTLRSGQEFELEPSQGYKLIDVSEEAATIKDLASGEPLSIPRLETDALIVPPSSE